MALVAELSPFREAPPVPLKGLAMPPLLRDSFGFNFRKRPDSVNWYSDILSVCHG